MELPHELLAECVTCLRRDQKDRLGQERRVLPRFRIWAPLDVEPGPDRKVGAITAWVRDLSRGGIGIMHTQRLEPGTQFIVTLPRMDGGPERLVCQVVYCADGAPDLYSIGAQFLRREPAGI